MLSWKKCARLAVPASLAFVAALLTPTLAFAEAGKEVVSGNALSKFIATDSIVGSVVIWSLMLCSVALVAIIIQTALKVRKSLYIPQDFVEEVETMIREKQYKEALAAATESDSPMGQILKHAMLQARRGYDAMETAVFEMAEQIGNERVRSLVWMEIAGAAGPMMGLFGTVYGMIVAFSMLVNSGGAPKPAELAGGIATALVCTFWGLVVGIPGVISATVFRVKCEGLTSQAIWIGTELIAPFRTGASAPAPAAASGAAAQQRKSIPPAPAPSAVPANA